MDIVEALLQLNRVAGDVDQPTDLQIGTVVKAPPDDDVLEISINTEMATLRQDILYLAEPVIEKKIPLLKHRHAMPHIHAGVHGSTGAHRSLTLVIPCSQGAQTALYRARTSKAGRMEKSFR